MKFSRFVLFFLPFAFYLFLSGTVKAVDYKDKNSICLKAERCDLVGNRCSDEDHFPLIRVHRVLLEQTSALPSDTVYFYECIETREPNSRQFCIPLPIKREGSNWVLRNYKGDGNSSVKWKEADGKQAFIDAQKEVCIASHVVQDSTTEQECQTFINTYWAAGGEGGDIVNGALTNADYQFHGMYQVGGTTLRPITTPYPIQSFQGSTFEWGSSSEQDLHRSFRAVTFTNPITGTSGGAPSNKVGQLGFINDEPRCAYAPSYDPYGQVFDTTTFQPTEDVTVALYGETPGGEYKLVTSANTQGLEPSFRNPVLSNELGKFSFLVPANRYKLLAIRGSSPPSELPVPPIPLAGIPNSVMNTNAASLGTPINVLIDGVMTALYPEPYQVTTTGTTIDIPVIDETVQAQRRDLAVQGVTPASAKVLSYTRTVNAAGDSVVTGKINKPFGAITANKQDGTQLVSGTADINGDFIIVIPVASIPAGESIVLNAVPRQLTGVTPTAPQAGIRQLFEKLIGLIMPAVRAESVTKSVLIQPRLSYIEGYAYDGSGAILPNAEVIIMDSAFGAPVYSTTTDEKGYYKITSEKLPTNDYTIWYKSDGSSSMISVTAENFLSQNKKFITESNINVNVPQYGDVAQEYLTQHPQPSITTGQGYGVGPKQGTPGELNKGVAPTRAVQQSSQINQLSPALLMYVAILLLLIVGAGLLIVYYMKRKQEPHLYE